MKAQNQAELKRENKERLLKLIITRAPISRVELAHETGLTKMTVSNLIAELIADGIVTESGRYGDGPGRKKVCLGLQRRARLFVGMYISRTHLTCFLGDLSGSVFEKQCIRLQNETNQTLADKAISAVGAILQPADRNTVLAIGISCIGPLEYRTGTILNPPHFFRVADLSLGEILRDTYSLPVLMGNDMDASALAEQYFGHAKSIRDFIYVGVSNGVGAGVVTEGKLLRGERGFSGEIGHVTVDINGPQCSCGNRGCLEQYAAFPDDFAARTQKERQTIWKSSYPYLAAGITTLINLFDTSCIFIGHETALCGRQAAAQLEQEIAGKYISAAQKQIPVRVSAFGENAPLIGAIALCVEHIGELL